MSEKITTDSWPLKKILKHILLPKPKDAPKAGVKEICIRITLFGIGAAFAYHQYFGEKMPACDAKSTISLIEKIVNDLPIAKKSGAKFVSLKEVTELGFNKNSEIRSCNATLISTKGEDTIQYSVQWQDKSKNTVWVEAQIEVQPTLESINNEAANQMLNQYFMAKRNGAAPVDLCVQAGLVTAGYLQASDEENYKKWKNTEQEECLRAGIQK